jgi:hypothetical protein
MSRLPTVRAVLAAAVALCSLALVSTASAAAWTGPTPISAANVNALGATIALGTSGDAVALWQDDAVAGGRLAMARKRAGSAWSAPVTAVTPFSGTTFFAGVDASGNVTAAYATGSDTTIVSWPATAAAPTVTPLVNAGGVIDLAVDAAGDAVFAALTPNPSGLTVGYRQGPTGTFSMHTYTNVQLGFSVSSARVAINSSGVAAVVFLAGPHFLGAIRTGTADWPATPENIEIALTVNGDPAVGIDTAGNVLAAFTYQAGTAKILRTARRPATGGWIQSGDLSPTSANASADFPDVMVSPAGSAALVWSQTTAGSASVKALYGSSTAGVGTQTEDVSPAGAMAPTAAIGNDGSVVAAWERTASGTNVDEAVVRTPGATGTWGTAHALSAAHTNTASPSLSGDGQGDFATLDTPYNGTFHPVELGVYDAAPPAVVAAATGNLFAGSTVTLAAKATDAWSAVGTPAWTFGDGGSGAGASVPHVYSAPGTYTAHVSVTDGAGNTAGADVTVVVKEAAQATLASARFRAKWKQSRVSGTLLVTGTTPITGTYGFDVSKGKTRKIHVSVKLNAGTFSRSIQLPVKLVPGVYHVAIVPVSKVIQPATLNAILAAPAEGVVDTVKLGRTRAGETVRFHFAALPKAGKLTLTWYRLVKGKRARVTSASKARKATITGSLSLSHRHGSFTVVLARAGKVVAQGAFKVR